MGMKNYSKVLVEDIICSDLMRPIIYVSIIIIGKKYIDWESLSKKKIYGHSIEIIGD